MLLAVGFTLAFLLQTLLFDMALKMILIFVGTFAALSFVSALPDSAGMVEMPNGLAYGGIPYGSVSGMVANYGKSQPREISSYAAQNSRVMPMISRQTAGRSVIPLIRGGGAAPVQIFSHPGVVAPGVVGMIHQVGYQ